MDLSHLSWLDEQGNSHTTERHTCSWLSFFAEGFVYETRLFSTDAVFLGRVALTTYVQITNTLLSHPMAGDCLGRAIQQLAMLQSTALAAPCLTVCLTAPEGAENKKIVWLLDRRESQPQSGKFRNTNLQKLPTLGMSFMCQLEVDVWGILSHTRTKLRSPKELFGHSFCLSALPAASLAIHLRGQAQHSPLLRSLGELVLGVIFVTINAR